MLPASYQLPAAIVLLLGGIVACFFGYRMFRLVLAIFGFIFGAFAASSFFGQSDTTWMLAAAAVGGLVGAGILTEIDPAASTEARDADLSARIKKALHDYPALRGTPPPPTSGGAPPTGGTKAPTFSRAQIAQMTPAEIEKHQAAIDEWLRAGAPEA